MLLGIAVRPAGAGGGSTDYAIANCSERAVNFVVSTYSRHGIWAGEVRRVYLPGRSWGRRGSPLHSCSL